MASFRRHTLLTALVLISPMLYAEIDRTTVAGFHAAYIYSISKFVSWPQQQDSAEFTICIYEDSLLAAILHRKLHNRTVREQPVRVLQQSDDSSVSQCKILYLPTSSRAAIRSVLQKSASMDLLTISDDAEFIEMGGMVQFYIKDERLQFEINTAAIATTHLSVSSQLLALSRKHP